MNDNDCRSQSRLEGVAIAKFNIMLLGLTRKAVTLFTQYYDGGAESVRISARDVNGGCTSQ